MKKLILFGALLFALNGCASTGGDSMGGDAEAAAAKTAIADAEAAVNKANKAGGGWRDTGKFLKEAKAALEKKDYATAIKKANKAKSQGEMGLDQAMGQKDAGPWLF